MSAVQVATLGDISAQKILPRLRLRLRLHPEGRHVLSRRPVVDDSAVPLEKLRSLPSNTFGHAYARFMDEHSYRSSERPTVKYG